MIYLDFSFGKWTVLTISVFVFKTCLKSYFVHLYIYRWRETIFARNTGCWSSLWFSTIPWESLGLFDTTHGTNCNQQDPRMSSTGTLRMRVMTPQSRWGLWGHQGKRKVAVLFAVPTNSTSAFVCASAVVYWYVLVIKLETKEGLGTGAVWAIRNIVRLSLLLVASTASNQTSASTRGRLRY